MQTKMKIGELAKRTGFSTKAIRYYELLGLLAEPERTESGYRLYGPEDVERLEFIEKAKRLGFSLEDIRDVLVLHQQQETPCVHVLALLEQKLTRVDGVGWGGGGGGGGAPGVVVRECWGAPISRTPGGRERRLRFRAGRPKVHLLGAYETGSVARECTPASRSAVKGQERRRTGREEVRR